MKKLLVILAAVAALCAAPAHAATIIDFGNGTAHVGTLTVTDGVYVGTGISVPVLSILQAPLNSGTYDDLDAVLAFRYGGGYNEVTVTTPGGFTLQGPDSNLTVAPNTVLLSGTFSAFNPTLFAGGLSVNGTGPDIKDPALLAWIGLAENTPFELFGFSLAYTPDEGTPGTYTAFSTDISNTAVPEPASMFLLGSGLVGLAGAVRRRVKK